MPQTPSGSGATHDTNDATPTYGTSKHQTWTPTREDGKPASGDQSSKTTPNRSTVPPIAPNCHTDRDSNTFTRNIPAEFVAEQCLFCNSILASLDDNIVHMSKKHGLFIPDLSRLLVEMETLLRYLHLVVFEYQECLWCHVKRSNIHATQQHMLSKSHCKIDLETEGSEYRDFWAGEEDGDVASDNDSEGDENRVHETPVDTQPHSGIQQQFVRLDDNSLRLASGKILSHRSSTHPKPGRRPLTTTEPSPSLLESSSPASEPLDASTHSADADAAEHEASQAQLSRAERRGGATLAVALSKLSVNDQAALAHLPAAEQRAVVLRQFKQQDKARIAARRYQDKQERKNNSVLMKHFVSDVPGPKLG